VKAVFAVKRPYFIALHEIKQADGAGFPFELIDVLVAHSA